MKPGKCQCSHLLFFLLVCIQPLFSQTVLKHPDSTETLEQRWQWALQQVRDKKMNDGFWIGYSIQKMMGEQSTISSSRSGDWQAHPSLSELIHGGKSAAAVDPRSDDEIIRDEARHALERASRSDPDALKIKKEVAVLFQFGRDGALLDVQVNNISLSVDLGSMPLIWLHGADTEQSLHRVEHLYREMKDESLKDELITAAGVHESSETVVAFLQRILESDDSMDLREQAAFWLGQQNRRDALHLLTDAAQHDSSPSIREKAVFGMSQMTLPEGTVALTKLAENARHMGVREQAIFWLGQRADSHVVKFLFKMANTDHSESIKEKAVFALSQQANEDALEALIDLARHGKTEGTRKKAIFWLGQKASARAGEALEKIADGDDDLEIQEQALFALSQLPGETSVPMLIKLSTRHSNPEIRKKAVFWLGQSDDPRALETLIDIVRK